MYRESDSGGKIIVMCKEANREVIELASFSI